MFQTQCGVNISFHPEFPESPTLLLFHLHANWVFTTAEHLFYVGKGVETNTVVFSSTPFLVPNWSGAQQSPQTRPWSFCQKGWVGG